LCFVVPPSWAQTDAKQPATDAPLGETITNSIGMKLALIPAGEFWMGSPKEERDRGDDEKRHRVRITRPYYIGVYEVTLDEFMVFYHADGYKAKWKTQGDNAVGGLKWKDGKFQLGCGDQNVPWRWGHPVQSRRHPVVDVSRRDAIAFCEWLSGKEEKRYRLPTEAEWEYACRGKTTTAFFNGNDPERLADVGNPGDASVRELYDGPFGGMDGRDDFPFTAPVGLFRPNAFGLYDTHGNAMEWCSDYYSESYYDSSPVDDPRGPDPAFYTVVRGGSWLSHPAWCRCAARSKCNGELRAEKIGFRVVREQ
jgi:formylglycine-generating enzyme required for sulfatase activity